MKKLCFASILILFTTSHIQASFFIDDINESNDAYTRRSQNNQVRNPLTDDQQKACLNATSSSIMSPVIEVPHHPPFDPTLGSPCWQATKSYYADTKTCCMTRSCTGDKTFSHLPKPVAQYRECCMNAETGCAKATCFFTLGCLTLGSVALVLNGCVIP